MKMIRMRETVKSAWWRVEEYQDNNTMRMIHGWRARKTLEPMSRVKCSVHTGLSFRTQLHLPKWQPCPVCLPTYSRTNKSRHCHFDEIPNLLFEHVVDWSNTYNHDMHGYFACTAPFLDHHRVLSNRSSAVLMTNLAELEVRKKSLSRTSQT